MGAISWLKAGLLIISQILGAIAAAGIVSALLPGPLAVRTSLSASTSVTRGLFIEMLLTAELIFCIFMLAAEKHKATFLAPIGIGLALFVAELAGKLAPTIMIGLPLTPIGVFFTGGSLNPARSFGPDVILGTFDGYHWVYWVGPVLGAIVAVVFYRLIKLLEYETANPGADSDGREERYPESPEVTDDVRRESKSSTCAEVSQIAYANSIVPLVRPTDGTDDTMFMPPIHAFNKPVQTRRTSSSRCATNNTTSANSGVGSLPSPPIQPLSVHQLGYDGHESIDHPNDRPRAQHCSNSAYGSLHSRSQSRSHHSHHVETSDCSFRNAPSAESGSSSYSSSSRGNP